MQSAQLVLALLIAVAALVTIARRLGIAYPIFLVIGGLALGLVPGTPRVDIDPDLIFLVVLPPLLYIASFYTRCAACGRTWARSARSPSAW
jgi:monovalent cation/hydrogen antiporter